MSAQWHELEIIGSDGVRIHGATCSPAALPGELVRVLRLMAHYAARKPRLFIDDSLYVAPAPEPCSESDEELLADLGL